MNLTISNFLKPGTSPMEVIAGIALILLFVAGTAGFMGWLSVQDASSAAGQSMQAPAAQDAHRL